MDKMTFGTREAAEQEIRKMRGWNAKPAQAWDYEPKAGNPFLVWVIEISGYGDPKYLRKDGYVR